MTVTQRWMSQLDTSGECWVFTGHKRNGYGAIHVGTHGRSRMAYVHRLAWEYVYGPVPDGLYVLHHCDNPPCARPSHLFLGTQTDNMRDAAKKGRLRTQKMRTFSHTHVEPVHGCPECVQPADPYAVGLLP